ncbi:conserved Plasmodium protein, unknown function [Plasmodium vivax]|uniref:RAP domain-containing protein n=1 Tax=Plasmodium vivax TaxID=5855 RepID=A0A564ZQ19_PLAVI|nr:conserved Plasmodium protein, unknown function [Plasmodium vivax]
MKRAPPVSSALKRATIAVIPPTRGRGSSGRSSGLARRGIEGRYSFSTERICHPTGGEANVPKNATRGYPPYSPWNRDALSSHYGPKKENKKGEATTGKATPLKKSNLISLINGVKQIEESNTTQVVDLLVDIILQVRYDEGSITRMKEKHTIGFIWAMAKIVNLLQKNKLMSEQVVLHWKVLFIYFAHMYMRRAIHLGGGKRNEVDERQYVSSVLSLQMGEADLAKLTTSAFCSASGFAKCLFEWRGGSHGGGHPRKGEHPEGKHHPGGDPPPNDLFRIFSSPSISEMVTSVQRYILQRIEPPPLDIKTILNFLEMASRNWGIKFKGEMIEVLLGKLEAPPNQIRNFTIFNLCRFLNLTVNYGLQRGRTEEAHLPAIIDLLLRGQSHPFGLPPQGGAHDGGAYNCAAYRGAYRGAHEGGDNLLAANTLANRERLSPCSTWLLNANERDLSSLVRDFSRLAVRNNQLYRLLVECFLLKMGCGRCGGNREFERGNTHKAEKQKRGTQHTATSTNMATTQEMRNWVDILVGLANANYHYDPFVERFIQMMVIKRGSLFFTVKNIPNVVLSLRSLLSLGHDQMDTLSHFFNFISRNFRHVQMKQLIMIFYSTYCHIVQRYNLAGAKYVGAGNLLFSVEGGGGGEEVGTEVGAQLSVAVGAGGDPGGPPFCGREDPLTDMSPQRTPHRLTSSDAHAPSPREQLEAARAHLFQHLHKLEGAIFHRRHEIDSMQGLVNFFLALSCTINTLSVERYHFFYQSFWRILKGEVEADGKIASGRNVEDTIKAQTVVQICLLHYKNNVVHKTLLSYLLSILETLPQVDIHSVYPITFVCCHFNIVTETFLKFALRVLLGEMAKGEPRQEGANGANRVGQANGNSGAGGRHHFEEGSNGESGCRVDPPTGRHAADIHHLHSNDQQDTVNKVAKCAWSLLLSSAFLESSITTFAKMCILLRRTFASKLHWREEDYNMMSQMLVCLNMYYKKNKNLFQSKKGQLRSPTSFYIPYCVVKETVRRNKMSFQQKLHMSSFQYKLCEYLKRKKIMYKSEHFLKRGFVVDILVLKKGEPHLVLEVDGIYHYNMSTDERNYEVEHNGMRLSKNGRTAFRNNVLRLLYDLEFVCVPWFFFLQPRSFQRLEGLLSGRSSGLAPCDRGDSGTR